MTETAAMTAIATSGTTAVTTAATSAVTTAETAAATMAGETIVTGTRTRAKRTTRTVTAESGTDNSSPPETIEGAGLRTATTMERLAIPCRFGAHSGGHGGPAAPTQGAKAMEALVEAKGMISGRARARASGRTTGTAETSAGIGVECPVLNGTPGTPATLTLKRSSLAGITARAGTVITTTDARRHHRARGHPLPVLVANGTTIFSRRLLSLSQKVSGGESTKIETGPSPLTVMKIGMAGKSEATRNGTRLKPRMATPSKRTGVSGTKRMARPRTTPRRGRRRANRKARRRSRRRARRRMGTTTRITTRAKALQVAAKRPRRRRQAMMAKGPPPRMMPRAKLAMPRAAAAAPAATKAPGSDR
mmetsp:Transcript_100018/g.282381  ORF Transcript_100018/g.282381 Transcript_100018/m.282381 type:complete len:363 (-) Transcript_100018:214-1302(-)